MESASERLRQLLEAAELAGDALSFVVIIPGWKETRAWQRTSSSKYLRKSVVVAAADHGFCDGASHQRKDAFRQSPYDTGVFVLQTTKGAARWRIPASFEKAGVSLDL